VSHRPYERSRLPRVPPTQRPAKVPGRGLPAKFGVKLVGCSFVEGYPTVFHHLHELWMGGDGPDLDLAREPDNEHDPNSVAVVVAPTMRPGGIMHQGGLVVGHIPRSLVARLGPSLDDGDEWVVTFWEVLLATGSEQQPGLSIQLHRKHKSR
jgi:hypothetical protein